MSKVIDHKSGKGYASKKAMIRAMKKEQRRLLRSVNGVTLCQHDPVHRGGRGKGVDKSHVRYKMERRIA